MPRYAWKDEYYVRIFELSRQGMSSNSIADALGISRTTFKEWKKTRPAVLDALKRGRTTPSQGKGSTETFLDYVYGRLPSHLKELWDQMKAYEKEENGEKKLEALLENQGKRTRQHLFIHALVSSNFNASEACRRVNITKACYEKWIRTDPLFLQLVEEIPWHKKNFFEGALIGLVAQGDSAATVFAAKTQLRDRGYDPKKVIEHRGMIGHAHFDIQSLKLPLEVRRTLLEAIENEERSQQLALPAGDTTDTDVQEAEVVEVNDEDDGE